MLPIRAFWTRLALAALGLVSVVDAQGVRYRDVVFPTATVSTDLTYGIAFNRAFQQIQGLQLDMYQPALDTETSRPAIVIVHGGGFHSGSRSGTAELLLGFELAQRGYVAVSISYRLVPLSCLAVPPPCPGIDQATARRDAAHDLKAAVRWLRRNAATYGIDPERIAAIGASAGAMTCMEAAYAADEGTSGNPGFSSELSAVVDLWGDLLDVNEIDAGEAPLQIVHGDQDAVVPFQGAIDLDRRAGDVGLPHEFFPIIGGIHAPYPQYYADVFDDTLGFLYEHLKLSEIAGLSARPGYTSPGTLTIDTFGLGGDIALLLIAPLPGDIVFPGFGTYCLDPVTTQDAGSLMLSSSNRISTQTFSFQIPPGLTGTQFWQVVHLNLNPGRLRWLTNCVQTDF